MKPDLFWIPGPWRGKLAIAARPRGGDWLDDEASGWRRAGVDVVVSLLEENEAVQLQLEGEEGAARAAGMDFISFPIPDREAPSCLVDACSLFRQLGHALDNGRTVAVHCRQGIGRSGLIAAGLLMGSGIGAEQAAATVSGARGLTVPETPQQMRWLERLPREFPIVAAS